MTADGLDKTLMCAGNQGKTNSAPTSVLTNAVGVALLVVTRGMGNKVETM